jgi:hypothetical protein
VPSIRFRLDPARVRDVAARVREEYGPAARVVATDEVRVGGLGGFFAKRYLDVTVELAPAARTVGSPAAPMSAADGLAALLDDADRAESELPAVTGAPDGPPISTQSDEFSELLAELRRSVGAGPAEPPVVGSRFRAVAGALLAIAGLGDDPLVVARALVAELPAARLAVSGELHGDDRVDDRRSALAARARGVEQGAVVVVAVGLGRGGPASEAAASRLTVIAPDAAWVAVDATRKPDDTARWVRAVRAVAPVRDMAVLGCDLTGSPESVRDLGLRQAWSDEAVR